MLSSQSNFYRRSLALAGTVLLALCISAPAQVAAQQPAQQAVQSRFAAVDEIIEQAVAKGLIPGGVVLVGHRGQVVFRKAYGMCSLESAREPMTVDTIFDIASLTKCVATATSVMRLVEQGKVRLNDPLTAYLPEFGANGKNDITVPHSRHSRRAGTRATLPRAGVTPSNSLRRSARSTFCTNWQRHCAAQQLIRGRRGA